VKKILIPFLGLALALIGSAVLAAKPQNPAKAVVQTDRAPKAIGPYSQAIVAGGLIFCSGQLGLDPAAGKLVAGGIEAETRQALENLKAVLEKAGSSLDRVVKTTVILADMAEFAAMNKVYAEFFPSAPPARATFQAAGLALQARVEIEAIAIKP
jgi:2-iminobutanoate/2-iminopropanoate deaminase